MSDVLIGAAWALVAVVVVVAWSIGGPVVGLLAAVVVLLGVIAVRVGRGGARTPRS